MRIRSTKPEFWRSERIASVEWEHRLVLKGLESYVDDNGVGKDDLALIVADVFPRDLSRNPTGTLQKVSEALSALSEAGLLWRYEADGTSLLYVAFWESVQRIEKPSKGRFRRPDGTSDYRESQIGASVPEYSRNPPGTLRPGTGEQGNRGTGEQGSSAADAAAGKPGAELAIIDAEIVTEGATAQTLTAEWIDHCVERPPRNVIGQVSKQLKQMLDEGIDPDRIRRALAEWNRKGLHPSTLPSVVHEIANRQAPMTNRQAAENAMWDRAMERAIEREREMGLRP